ncbi:hypothetical protein OHR68_21125 [Spirillospora sp. NBC_00431]
MLTVVRVGIMPIAALARCTSAWRAASSRSTGSRVEPDVAQSVAAIVAHVAAGGDQDAAMAAGEPTGKA